MTTLYRLELLLTLRDKALPGTKAREALDRIVDNFFSEIHSELESEIKSSRMGEQITHLDPDDVDSF